MRLTFAVDKEPVEAEVDLDRSEIRFGGRVCPFRVLSTDRDRVELEIEGERVLVEGWPDRHPEPTSELSVNGERLALTALERLSAGAAPVRARLVAEPAAPAPSPPSSGGVELRPPLPGKLLELEVRVGDHVTAGQVVLVLEAMKMKNEVAAPATGTVTELPLSPGSSVRAQDVLLRVRPD